jgi:hypothetical protein
VKSAAKFVKLLTTVGVLLNRCHSIEEAGVCKGKANNISLIKTELSKHDDE